ncbi:hypothetical protein DAEQUDRAFT_807895 [Daedalea quercina L-15889]|uniref:Uncharacterized protein n=1 Tax=Daedalea quercina L-15889 TaxID=1314783 RepID=A0A165U0S2_9APHY|nr:hypothetical protein DAEQUDRAFT_807895 [Daedalea quercina L-15889]
MLPGTPSRNANRRDPRRRGRRSPISRSSSILGSLKSFIVSPLSWFSSQEDLQDDFEDTPGKRRRNPQAADRDERENEAGEARAKRQRVQSPEPEPQQRREQQPTAGYLDIPDGLILKNDGPPRLQVGHTRSSSMVIPPSRPYAMRPGRHSLSPLAGSSYTQPLSVARTMSMDPPTGYRPRALSRDISMGIGSERDVTMTPSRTPFQLRPRTSMTPQPAGQRFGPAVPRLERDASVPPPFETLTSKPAFVRPPPQSQSQSQGSMLSMEPTLTLGSLAESQPRPRRMSPFDDVSQSRSSLGRSSTLIIARSGSLDGGSNRTENPAERVLQDLDVYKTPLLPTRLRGSPGVPDMFKHRKIPIPVLMAGEHGKKTRLGSADKEKDEPGAKPYAGKGGMKKLLARRKQEVVDQHEKEKESAMDEEQEAGPSQLAQQKEAEPRDVPPLPRLTVPEFPPAPAAGRSSSLRIGRSKTSRSHAPSAQRGKNRFSATYDEEEGDDAMLTSEDGQVEAPKPPSLFQPPAGFSFAKDVSADVLYTHTDSYNALQTAPIRLDSSASKEPPIAALPFSFSKPASDSAKAIKQSVPSVLPVPKGAEEHPNRPPSDLARANQEPAALVPTVAADPVPSTTATAPPTPVLQTIPSIALTPATPAAPSPAIPSSPGPTEKAPSGVPNFFANSSILSKPATPITLPTGTSLFGGSTSTTTTSAPSNTSAGITTTPASAAPSELKNADQKEAPKQPVFGLSGAATDAKAGSAGPAAGLFASPFGAAASVSSAPKAPSDVGAASTSGTAATSIFGGASAKSAEQPSSSGTPFAFGAPAKPAAAGPPPTGASLLGSTAPKPAEPVTGGATAAAPATTSQTFCFGAPAKPAEKSAAPSPFSFGAPAKPAEGSTPPALGPPANIEKPTSPAPPVTGFNFGPPKDQQVKVPESMSTSVPEQPKTSLFGGSSNTFSGFGNTPTSSAEPAKAPFKFGQPAAATAPASSTTAVQAPKPLFGSSGASGFSFGVGVQGSIAPTEPVAPAKSLFSFGASPATPPATSTEKPPFTFGVAGGASAPPQGSMVFGGPTGGSHSADVSSKPFAFGPVAAPARPATPPRNDQEVRMDESPTRGAGMDMSGHGGAKEPLKLTTGFPFTQPGATTSPFGQTAQSNASTSPFTFSASSSAPSVFGGAKTESKQETKTSGFGFGQSSGSGFSFGQKPADAPAPSVSPNSFGGSGGFGQTSAAPSASAPFAFGRSTSSGGSGGFGQTSATSSTPSPSAFGSSTGFPFSATPTSATAPSNPFPFGSQPASPATSNPGLPSASGTTNAPFQFGQPTQTPAPAPASPFGAPAALPPSGAVFNIGAASAPAPATGVRQIKKLPTRRGGKR